MNKEWTMEELYFKYGLSVGYISFYLGCCTEKVRRHLIKVGAVGLIETEEEWRIHDEA